MSKIYSVRISETLCSSAFIEADDECEAQERAEELCNNETISLTYEDFDGRDFEVREVPEGYLPKKGAPNFFPKEESKSIYSVEVTETVKKTVYVSASDAMEAESLALRLVQDEEIDLCSGDFENEVNADAIKASKDELSARCHYIYTDDNEDEVF